MATSCAGPMTMSVNTYRINLSEPPPMLQASCNEGGLLSSDPGLMSKGSAHVVIAADDPGPVTTNVLHTPGIQIRLPCRLPAGAV